MVIRAPMLHAPYTYKINNSLTAITRGSDVMLRDVDEE